jgi:hypothetical protein
MRNKFELGIDKLCTYCVSCGRVNNHQPHTTMTHDQLASTITNRLNGKGDSNKATRIHDVRHEDMVTICAALEVLTTLYQESGKYDPIKSFDARTTLWDLMNEYNVSADEVKAHELTNVL